MPSLSTLLGIKKPKRGKNATSGSSMSVSIQSSRAPFPSPMVGNVNIASQTSNPALNRLSASLRPVPTHGDANKNWASHRLEIMASTRTVLNILEKGLDGVPIPGFKAAVGAVSESLKALQTSEENDETISGVINSVENTQKALIISFASALDSSSPERDERIAKLLSELDAIRTSVERDSKSNKNLARRILDAERVAKALSGVMSRIQEVGNRFLIQTTLSMEKDIRDLKVKELNQEERDLLQRLRPVTAAFHDARDASPPCLEGTRVQLLTDINAWFDGVDGLSSRVFWLNGLAGTGKTTVARSVAALAHEQHRLAATFFFSRNNAATRDAGAVIPTLVYQLAAQHLVFRSLVCTAVASDLDVRDRAIGTQARTLLSNLVNATTPSQSLLIIIDALDECEPGDGEKGIDVVRNIIRIVTSVPFLKLLVTSRVERNIKDMFAPLHANKLALHCDIESQIVRSDIYTYLERKFSELARTRQLDPPFPSTEDLDELVKRADTLFIYAATVFKYIADRKDNPILRLRQILNPAPAQAQFQYKTLDRVYSQVISEAANTTGDPETHFRNLYSVLSTVIVLQEPLPISALADMAGIGEEETKVILQLLSSILLVEDGTPVRLYHPSFPDFITDEKRCQDEGNPTVRRFLVVPGELHMHLASQCLQIMNDRLRRDICDIRDASLLNSEVPDLESRLAQVTPSQLRYACKFWLVHLRFAARLSEEILDILTTFTKVHLPHWLEVLSLINELSIVQSELPSLIAYLNELQDLRLTCVCSLLCDMRRTAMVYRVPIASSALHVYHSAFVTVPSCYLQAEITGHDKYTPVLISPRSEGWGSHVLVLEGHDMGVNFVAFSPDDKYIASASNDSTVRVWDVTTGLLRYILPHSHWAVSVVFSPRGDYIASGCWDCAVWIWDAHTGTNQYILTGHSQPVLSVAFSPDGKHIVSGSADCTVRVWDAIGGTLQRTLGSHHNNVNSVVFSPNSKYISSGSDDGTLHIWNSATGTLQRTISGHIGKVISVSFSPDSMYMASGCSDYTVRVWDMTTGLPQRSLRGHEGMVTSVVFSPDGQHIASASCDTVYIWNTATFALQHKINVQSGQITSITFSHNGKYIASGSHDRIVHVWHAMANTLHRKANGHNDSVTTVIFSPDGEHIASVSGDCTVYVWSANDGTIQCFFDTGTDFIVFSSNGKHLASGSLDGTVRVWDVTSGTLETVLSNHIDKIVSFVVSPDGQLIASTSMDYTVRVWVTATGSLQHVFSGASIMLSLDSQYTASASKDRTFRDWDVISGMLQLVSNENQLIAPLGVSRHCEHIASGNLNETVRTWDTTTSSLIHILEKENSRIASTTSSSGDPISQSLVRTLSDSTSVLEPFLTSKKRGNDIWPRFELDHWTGWISRHKQGDTWRRVCWLPPKFRGNGRIAYSGQKVAVGAKSGALTILDFSRVE